MDIYQITKLVLTIIFAACSLFAVVCLIRWIIMVILKNPDKKKRVNTAKATLIAAAIAVIAMIAHFMVAVKQYDIPIGMKELPTFNITSDNLHDGVWDEKVGAKHGNVSPQLSWNKVDGAAAYAIVMIDNDGNNWLHWAVKIDDTQVEEGHFKDKSEGYVGPYPPSGSHYYTIYVIALKDDAVNYDVQLDKGNADIAQIFSQLDSGSNTEQSNIIAMGSLVGSYGEGQ